MGGIYMSQRMSKLLSCGTLSPPLAANTVMYCSGLREACAVPASELLCNNGTNPGNPGWITPTLAANEEIHVFVAGYGVALYTVTVTAVP